MDQQKLDRAIGRRLKTLRTQAGMTLNELAARSGVSRAMIGRVERAQSSATASLLNKLCAALDVSLSDVVALAEEPPERLVRLADQPLWRDPDSGYRGATPRRRMRRAASRSSWWICRPARGCPTAPGAAMPLPSNS